MTFFSYNVLNVNLLKCVSLNNQECKIRPEIINVNSNEPSFYPYSTEVNKYSGIYNNITDPYAKLCVPDVVKNINVKKHKVFNLISRIDKMRHLKQHQTCKCKCKLDINACNNKQRGKKDKCRCECKELIDKGRCDIGSIWNPSICEC